MVLTNKLIKIADRENICSICEEPFKHIRYGKRNNESGLYEVRIIDSHGNCRKAYNNYKKLKAEYEWAKFEYDLIRHSAGDPRN